MTILNLMLMKVAICKVDLNSSGRVFGKSLFIFWVHHQNFVALDSNSNLLFRWWYSKTLLFQGRA